MRPGPGSSPVTAVRGTLIYCRDDPFLGDPKHAFVHEPDGLVVCREGLIEKVGPYAAVKAELPAGTAIADYSGH